MSANRPRLATMVDTSGGINLHSNVEEASYGNL